MIIGYTRASDGNDTSPERQYALIVDYCQGQGWPAPTHVSDRVSGAKESNREGFQYVLDMVKSGRLKAIIVSDLSRLHRNTLSALRFVQLCERHKVKIVSLMEMMDMTNAYGRLAFRSALSFNEFISDVNKDKMRRLWQRQRERGLRGPGKLPYGYDCEDGRLIPNAREQAVIARMVAWYAEGYGYTAIASLLRREGILTKTGEGAWHHHTVAKIIRRHSEPDDSVLSV